MAKSSGQKLKLLHLCRIFEENTDEEHGITIQEIIEELARNEIHAERKGLYDDIDQLQRFGMDIVAEKRDRNYYYKLVSRGFETGELKLLVDAVQASRFLSERRSQELIAKLGGLTSRYHRRELQRQVYVVNRAKSSNEQIFKNIDMIHYAAANNLKIAFQYYKWNARKELQLRRNGVEYCISPWYMCWNDENYYLIAYDSEAQKIKHYRVDKMRRMRLTQKTRDGQEAFRGFSLPRYTKEHFGMFGGEIVRVTMRIPEELIGVMVDRFGDDVMIRPDDTQEGYAILHADVVLSEQFIGWLVGLGEGVTVLSPPKIREKLYERGKYLAQQYQSL